jgi:hypothetical protein
MKMGVFVKTGFSISAGGSTIDNALLPLVQKLVPIISAPRFVAGIANE